MKVHQGTSVLCTGAGSGIGRETVLALAKLGADVTVVDLSEEGGRETVRLIEEARQTLSGRQSGGPPAAIFVKCDVTKPEQLVAAFKAHLSTYGKLDICINNAGIMENTRFLDDASENGAGAWRKVVDINLTATIDGTRLALRAMLERKTPGAIVNIASAAGLYPTPFGPIYAASKGGVVQFTRSLAHFSKKGMRVNALCPLYIQTPMSSPGVGLIKSYLDEAGGYIPMQTVIDGGVVQLTRSLGHFKRKGVRVNALCPEFIDTALGKMAEEHIGAHLKSVGGFIPMSVVVEGILELIDDDSKAGECMRITNRTGRDYWRPKNVGPPARGQGKPVAANLPAETRKIVVHTLSTDFRSATRLVSEPMPRPAKGTILMRHVYAGINASDINMSAGRYFGSHENALKMLPFAAGFEAVGEVVAVGEGVKDFAVGAPVATLSYGGFAEYSQVDAKVAIAVPEISPELVAMLTSGLTASLGLEQGKMGTGETVLVTAAAGGTGQFAVQLAKLAGNTVVATCGGAEKAALLRSLGVDRVIDYRTEDVGQVLKTEFQQGMDVIYESVGGKMFSTCVNALARGGRLVVIGMMSQYTADASKGWAPSQQTGLPEKLLWKSQQLIGFFLVHHTRDYRKHLAKLSNLHRSGHLKASFLAVQRTLAMQERMWRSTPCSSGASSPCRMQWITYKRGRAWARSLSRLRRMRSGVQSCKTLLRKASHLRDQLRASLYHTRYRGQGTSFDKRYFASIWHTSNQRTNFAPEHCQIDSNLKRPRLGLNATGRASLAGLNGNFNLTVIRTERHGRDAIEVKGLRCLQERLPSIMSIKDGTVQHFKAYGKNLDSIRRNALNVLQ
ncbi:ARP protein [Klebsormidium nitens]|uniref:ARP protein n=1 Tax=Klebsormidium nitens TaxID=105231 RepID=A0A1Y1HS65_KLENI|nr:ARP protein [Klebsormidium nitens]|eukprot:GAQ80953.1 ARP protein [Klebsormidium nitens]